MPDTVFMEVCMCVFVCASGFRNYPRIPITHKYRQRLDPTATLSLSPNPNPNPNFWGQHIL